MQKASDVNAEVGLALGRARPAGLDDAGALTIEFEPGADKAFSFFQSPKHLDALEAILKEETDNVFKVKACQAKKKKTVVKEMPPKQHDVAVLKEASADKYEYLLNDASIAVVVDEFKGAIVTVQGQQEGQKKK